MKQQMDEVVKRRKWRWFGYLKRGKKEMTKTAHMNQVDHVGARGRLQ